MAKSLDLPGGYKIPVVGLGTWDAKDERELVMAVNAALELGYRHIDTAFAYENEKIIGGVLKQWFNLGKLKREDIFITTKLPVTAVRADKVEEFLKKSLENLGLDYVDLYLIHFPVCLKVNQGEAVAKKTYDTENTDHVAVWKKMGEQVDNGLTRSIGLSNFNIKQIQRILDSNPKHKPANLQVEVHVYFQQHELIDYCNKNGITVTAYSPLGTPGINKFLISLGQEPKKLPDMLYNEQIKQIGDKHKKSNAQVMLKFLLQKNLIVIPKSVKPTRLKENIDLFDFTLDNEDLKILNSMNVGPQARICDWKMLPGLEFNPEYPFEK